MEGVKHVMDSAEPCAESIVNKEPGAGANAASAAEMVLITTSPLSELIWTPQEGLSLKYADSAKAEMKASFMWKAESFNMIISASQCANAGGECSASRDRIAGDSTVLLNHSSQDIAHPAADLAPPRRSIDPHPISLIGSHQQDTRSHGDRILVKDRYEADLDLNQAVKLKNDEEPYVPRNTENVAKQIQSSIFSPGPSPELAETKAGFASTRGMSNEHHTGKTRIQESKKYGSIEDAGSHDSMSEKSRKSSSSVGSTECKPTDSALEGIGDDNTDKLKIPTRSPVHGSKNSFGMQFKNSGCHSKDDFNVAVLSQEVGKAGTRHDNIKNETGEFQSVPPYKVCPGNMEKGKEKVLCDGEDSSHSSKMKEDASESVESSSSQGLVPKGKGKGKGKRAFSFDLKISEVCKRTKQENNGPSWSKSFTGNDGSFVNWISNITSKFSRYGQNKTSLSLLPPSYNNMKEKFGSLRMSHEKTEGIMCKTVGFNSFFQAIYCPNIMIPDATAGDDHQREATTSKIKMTGDENDYSGKRILGNFLQFKLNKSFPTRGKQTYNGLKEVHLTSQALAVSSVRFVCDEDTGKSHDQVSPSSGRHNQVTYRVDNFPSIRINISSITRGIHEKLNQRNRQSCALKDMNVASSSARKDLLCNDEKEYGKTSSYPKIPVNVTLNNKNDFFENLWVNRFLQKVTSPILNSGKCNLSIDDNHALFREENFRKNHIPTQVESQREPAGEVQKHPTSLSFPWVLKMPDTQTLKPRISPMLPPEGVKKMELGQLEASCSRKRLDFNPSEMHNHNVSCAPITCFFCGKDGHNLRRCPELAENRQLDFRDFMDLYDGKNTSSCFCLRCFQADHWAISCPRASIKIKKTAESSFSVAPGSCHIREEKPEDPNNPNFIGKKNVWSQDSRFRLSERGSTRRDTQTHFPRSTYAHRFASYTANAIEDSQVESTVKMKQKASSCSENESRSNKITPLYNSIVPDVASGQNRIFKAVRRLRLSRTNLIRWMKSTNTSYSLEGFFVRLRLGKWERGPRGTGYQVARIISASRENCLSVNMGTLNCSLEFCFVSNQDYMEEELKAWLATTLEAGKLPSMEELNKKCKEREELGF